MKNNIEYVGFAYNLDDIEVEFIVNGVKKNLYIYSKGVEDILTFMDYQESEDVDTILETYFEKFKEEIFA
ncbi:hypothetical protein A8C46_00490 [Ligilactobacillus salivarius]|uniref:hypothetical protein n=1 Tax=Ligilactobacillus salivarius TaxID=1624 RepID=UPI000A2D0387|nr:hypothetical protein [Ligilactobacillus salivarius]OTF89726.1 hypothetical protein A8C38_00150 [Ligilactobacillus salivarius]PAY43561.1 hypothetical protein A8C39_00330 [Ligilactobacillus salivarius]PAY49375.1 hypothetical protein A8C42_00480 [Ligilactobacillus salivarius]PAY58079.1 hypothetical protein A8C46_00490 [Ligilactobacillus salivarius]PAY58744.1 hypothetical protein A8C40_01360 [Ligilactobacillus salivarius]